MPISVVLFKKKLFFLCRILCLIEYFMFFVSWFHIKTVIEALEKTFSKKSSKISLMIVSVHSVLQKYFRIKNRSYQYFNKNIEKKIDSKPLRISFINTNYISCHILTFLCTPFCILLPYKNTVHFCEATPYRTKFFRILHLLQMPCCRRIIFK